MPAFVYKEPAAAPAPRPRSHICDSLSRVPFGKGESRGSLDPHTPTPRAGPPLGQGHRGMFGGAVPTSLPHFRLARALAWGSDISFRTPQSEQVKRRCAGGFRAWQRAAFAAKWPTAGARHYPEALSLAFLSPAFGGGSAGKGKVQGRARMGRLGSQRVVACLRPSMPPARLDALEARNNTWGRGTGLGAVTGPVGEAHCPLPLVTPPQARPSYLPQAAPRALPPFLPASKQAFPHLYPDYFEKDGGYYIVF